MTTFFLLNYNPQEEKLVRFSMVRGEEKTDTHNNLATIAPLIFPPSLSRICLLLLLYLNPKIFHQYALSQIRVY